ncbi:hypothetical protein [Rheinheimera sp. 4Y26]|uniref:hypothetical protein n=1 Tax=Rheinheimera sp. 4Y26 TaxID=2977811 RepID=UPI0021B12CD9|nr:hypothetical protein [Rheinheimera sp. 4Y26]MCT6698580.1 hypothetical protein [Rheinheimera sp. 4Y26]
MTTTERYYQLQPDLTYRPLSQPFATNQSFCPKPRPDTVPLRYHDSSGKPLWLQLSNESGQLRWFGDTDSGVLVSNAPPAALPEPAVASPLLLTAAVPAGVNTGVAASPEVIWHDLAANQYQRADLTDLQAPRLRWRWSVPLAQQIPWLQTPVLQRWQNQQEVLLINSATAATPRLWLLQADSGKMLAEFDLQHYASGQQPVATLGALKAAPAALDLDGDGAFDRVYQIDEQGQLLRLDVSPDLSYQSALVADLSGKNAVYVSPLLAVRAILPGNLATVASRQAVDVLVLLAKSQSQYQLLVLFLADDISSPLLVSDLQQAGFAAQTQTQIQVQAAPAASPSQFMQLKRSAGWLLPLSGQPVWQPQLIAGVLYLPLQSAAQNSLLCADARQADSLLALHLYQATAVYSEAELDINMQLPLRLTAAADGSLQLQQSKDGVLILEGLHGVSESCAGCTEKLNVAQLSQWRQLAIYRQEEVY